MAMQRSTKVLVLVSDDLTHCSPHTRDLPLETPAGDAYGGECREQRSLQGKESRIGPPWREGPEACSSSWLSAPACSCSTRL